MLHFLFTLLLTTDGVRTAEPLPTADEVVAKMIQRDAERRSALEGYTSVRRYVLENEKHHKQAYMLVRMIQRKDGSKDFEMVSSSGWSGARKHVFPKLLEAESEASHPASLEESRVSPANYSFSMRGAEEAGGRKMYVIGLTPKKHEKYLVHGTVWIDAEDFAIVRMQGEPAKNPSFWIKSVQFDHKYRKHGDFWLAESDESRSDARIFGPTELRIDYFDYVLNTQEAQLR